MSKHALNHNRKLDPESKREPYWYPSTLRCGNARTPASRTAGEASRCNHSRRRTNPDPHQVLPLPGSPRPVRAYLSAVLPGTINVYNEPPSRLGIGVRCPTADTHPPCVHSCHHRCTIIAAAASHTALHNPIRRLRRWPGRNLQGNP